MFAENEAEGCLKTFYSALRCKNPNLGRGGIKAGFRNYNSP